MAKRNIRAASGKMSFLGSLARRHSGAESKVVLYLEGGKRIIGAVDALSHQGSSGNQFYNNFRGRRSCIWENRYEGRQRVFGLKFDLLCSDKALVALLSGFAP